MEAVHQRVDRKLYDPQEDTETHHRDHRGHADVAASSTIRKRILKHHSEEANISRSVPQALRSARGY